MRFLATAFILIGSHALAADLQIEIVPYFK